MTVVTQRLVAIEQADPVAADQLFASDGLLAGCIGIGRL
jgi:hypothetical protein